MQPISHLAFLLFTTHLRWTLWIAILLIWVLASGIFAFTHHIALVENTTAATAISSWTAHLLLIGLLIIWWASTLSEEHETRFDQVLYALPFSRTKLLLVRFFSWWFAGFLTAMLSLPVLWSLGTEPLFAFQWALSFALEITVVLALVLFYHNLSAQTPVVVLATALTYLFLRLLPYMEALSNRKLLAEQTLRHATQNFFQTIGHFFPSLKPFAASDILIDGISWQALGVQALIALLFSLFLLALTNFDLNKRELSA